MTKYKFTFSIFLFLLLSLGGLDIHAQNPKNEKVRVGCYESPFFHKDTDGRRSGYAYDYQLKVSAITGWEYEYVEGTWPELLDMMRSGEIDLLSDVTPLPERKASMLFSEYEMAVEDYLMMIPKKNSGIRIGEPQSVVGKRIGIEKNSVQVSLLKDWMKIYGVGCEIVELNLDANGLMSQLSQGMIDGLVAPISIDRGQFISAFTIGSAKVHFAVNKAKPELKNQLDRAMGQIHTNNPAFIYQLTETYFSNILNDVYLPEQECQWLKQYKTIRIGYRDDYLPFCKQNPETGEVEGLLQDFIEQSIGAFENADFKIEAVPYPSIKEAVEAVKRGELDAAFPHGIQLADAEKEGLVMTDPLYHSAEMAVMQKSNKFDPNKTQRAGLNNNNPNYISLIQSYYPHWTTVNFDNTPDCLEGIANGKADLMLLSSYRLGVLAQCVRNNRLKAVPTGKSITYGFVTKVGETEVLNIINRLTDMMDHNLVESSIISHSDVSIKTSTREFIEQNTLPLLTIILAISAVILFLLHRSHKERLRALKLAKLRKEHIDEIFHLNQDLEEHQAQLEELTAEQEAQLEEIHTLNEEIFKEKQQQEHYHDIISQSGNGVWTIILKDGAAPAMVCDMRMRNLLGMDVTAEQTPEEIYEFWHSRITPEALSSVNTSVAKMMEGQMDENTYLWIHPEKGNRYVRCGGTAQKMADGSYHLSGYHADVTDIVEADKKHAKELQQARDEAEAANHAKTSFLFNMSHDIRTPMNAIIGFTNLLRKYQEVPEKRNDYLDKIEGSSKVLLSIINNVLEMARIEKGTVSIDETSESVEQFNKMLVTIFSELMKQKGITFTHSVNVQHHNVKCDTTKLREIFYNLLSNAYKYTESGGTVDMTLKEIPSDREGYAICQTTIIDTGIGMSEEFLPHLFEEFARENTTTDNKIEGTGLGMSIVKRLVELMGGTIDVKSKKGIGTTFVVTLPHKIVADVEEETTAKVEVGHANFEGKRILLAEDNDLNAEIAMEILGEVGFVVERAENGRRAVEMVEQAEAGYYKAVLMDVQMPVMNGFEATRAIRQLTDPAKADVIIIAMTANAFDEDRHQSMASGMNGHLAKPIDVADLMNTLSSVIR